MKVVFFIYDLKKKNLPLQPWLTIVRIAKGLYQKGHQVHIVTDEPFPADIEGAAVFSVDSIRKADDPKMMHVLQRIVPDSIVFLPTPLNLLSTKWLSTIHSRRIAFLSYPFYKSREVYCASRLLPWHDVVPYIRHFFVPQIGWHRALYSKFDAVITQSNSTASRFTKLYKRHDVDVKAVMPGIDLERWPLRIKPHACGGTLDLLFLGAATAIRGFDVLLKAMSLVSDCDVHLNVLARGASEIEVNKIQQRAKRFEIGDRVTVKGGWCDQSRLVLEIQKAKVVLLPFVLVPSELPVSVMEVIACGTPVIGSNVDGLPSTIGPAGTVVRQGSARSLAHVIRRVYEQPSIISNWQEGCLVQREHMLDWERATMEWERVLFHG